MLLAGIFTTERATAEKTYKNPVLVETFSSPIMGTIGIGDPTVISYEGKYYLYPTGDNHSYDVYISSDLIHWEKGPKVFRYAESGVWAPDVFYNPADWKFYLYYTVHRRIGVAVADRPDGTFTDLGALVNNAIDAHLFLDEDGKYYLYYVQFPAFTICVQPMETPVRKKGEPLKIIQPGQLWEKKNGPVTEAPWVLKHQGIYYLLYSGGGPDTQDYAIGYAISQSPIGPFVKYFGNPIVKKGKRAFGPGHCSVIKTPDGKLWMVYHQKKGGSRGWDRIICIDQLWFDNTGTLHGKATRSTLQPAPVTAAKHMGKDKSP
jgi:beta-xylosidase